MTTPSHSATSYDWVHKIKPELKELDKIPLTGNTPPFPWDQLSSILAHTFEREGLTLYPKELTWRTGENLYEGIEESSETLNFSISSLQGQIWWVMPKQDMQILVASLLTKDPHLLELEDSVLVESFYRFFTIEVLYQLTQISFDKVLTPYLMSEKTKPNQDSLCRDISLQYQDQTIWGRLILSPDFRHSWVEYFDKQHYSSALTQQMAQVVETTVHLEVGKTYLSLTEWSAVQLGDFICLDNCSLHPQHLDGRVLLTINGKQAFRAKLKDGTLKILELPLLHEVDTPMAKQPEEHDEDDLSDLNLSEDDETFETLDEDDDLFDDQDTDLFTNTETEATFETSTEEFTPPIETQESSSSQTSKKRVGLITSDQIPVTLTVEVGRIQMTMDQILKLEPGNLLEVNLYPENGVDLTINGKMVGKGELIQIGEALGVRILELGLN